MFAKNFSKKYRWLVDDLLMISFTVSPSRINLRLHSISVTFKMVKKVITTLDSSKASGPYWISHGGSKELPAWTSYIQAELFNMCLKGSSFPDCWRTSSVVFVFKNDRERSTTKNHHLVSLLSVVSKFIKKLVNNGIVDHLEKCGLFFFYFQYGFRSSWSTADILTVASDKIARTSNRSRATQVVALDMSKDFDKVWHTDFLHKLNSDSELESDLWSVLEEKYLLRCCWSWLSLPNWTEAPTLSLLLKPPPRKLEPWFVPWSFFLLRFLCTSINLPYGHIWNIVVMPELVLLVATWNC